MFVSCPLLICWITGGGVGWGGCVCVCVAVGGVGGGCVCMAVGGGVRITTAMNQKL